MKPGYGDMVSEGQIVYVNYNVWIEGSDTPLDDSRLYKRHRDERKEYRFKVGAGEILPVIDIGVRSMQPFEVAKFLAEPEYAYGKLGIVENVPPGMFPFREE
jgi:FKBP-type peptidyl-prolyl cis-trans isomerase 2